jgi:hypothetical protein
MLLQFADVRKLKRIIRTVPVMTPRLSSYWLYFITSTSYSLAVNLVDSMKINVICRPNTLAQELGIALLPYREAVSLAFRRIEQNMVISSWKDAFSSFDTNPQLFRYISVPHHGCFRDVKIREVTGLEGAVTDSIWRIGGENGWYYGNFLWKLRGFVDKLSGGVGLRRGRRTGFLAGAVCGPDGRPPATLCGNEASGRSLARIPASPRIEPNLAPADGHFPAPGNPGPYVLVQRPAFPFLPVRRHGRPAAEACPYPTGSRSAGSRAPRRPVSRRK